MSEHDEINRQISKEEAKYKYSIMETHIATDAFYRLSEDEAQMSLISRCIELVADKLEVPYGQVIIRYLNTDFIKTYIKSNSAWLQSLEENVLVINLLEELDKREYNLFRRILPGKIGLTACCIAKTLNIDPETALLNFYASNTCRRLHNPEDELQKFGPAYIMEEYIKETHNGGVK